jgi:coenzyme F420-reducing hydrogenase gamma subunit
MNPSPKPRIAVIKLASCDGCQLAFLNLGEQLLELWDLVEIVHFAEAGPLGDLTDLSITFIEGSISTREDRDLVRKVRAETRFLVTIGACATSGGIQALRNLSREGGEWLASVYPSPEYIDFLDRSTPVASEIPVDLELWGCPVNGHQILEAIRSLLFGARPRVEKDKVCLECKRKGTVCVTVSRGIPCLGPVTLTGCGAICPAFGRGCYGCYGPSENPETPALGRRFSGLGLLPEEVSRRFLFINGNAGPFREEGLHWRGEVEHE